MPIQNTVVIGAGQMGSGIAQTLLQSGYSVALVDIVDAALERGRSSIESGLTRLVTKGRLTDATREEALRRLTLSTDLPYAVRDSDIVIEAAPEHIATKQATFAKLDASCPSHTILATNTSSLPITSIASVTKRADRVIGMHFMNPVPIMPLVEIIRGLATSDETCEAVRSLTASLGKTAVEVRDFPGFVSNRVLMPMINEAIYAVYEGIATPEAVDTVMKLGMNHPMGPLTLADFIGLDTCLAILETLHEGFGDSKYRPCPLLRQYVQAGWLGRKSGRGFYNYEHEQ
ncbi:3-hydroxybutyryl-CoA dehydrogenase [Paenibacillus cellulosilyticus]|uniref:3-hydroxybutyryl-CoA dehydrogenase n=1 Tax=Paenibacillus cellulosilyticus TaxID=375489 RepID=A0A2V2YM81_9BACL|nr:3-hydroxybutyryl-CoA dehydrogenase [Paenibacillus cellulosilyticus]PWV95229.1 3-hydroxybutyryl-CoA dehydrogenase [Paenibacillus cellulosilyticus]QKS46024.1 3-hydroxybutyryl-CoA dehydrogenase [Paenibacillus cellulosilyticus]